MSVIDKIRAKAAADVKHVVLAEGSEPRTVQAAEKIVKLGLAKITLVGAKAEIEAKAAELGVDLTGVMIVDPATSEKTASYAEQLFHIREKKGMTLEKATELCLKNTLFYGTMMLKMGDADAMVAGAINTTGDVLRPALQSIKGAPGIKTVSSCFLMEVQDKKYGDDGVLVFGDCAVNIEPNVDQKCKIVENAVKVAGSLGIEEPRSAMLSALEVVNPKIQGTVDAAEVTARLKDKYQIAGPFALDTAVSVEAAKHKGIDSPIAGKADILIVPDMWSGNIFTKGLVFFAHMKSAGTLNGLRSPVVMTSRTDTIENKYYSILTSVLGTIQ